MDNQLDFTINVFENRTLLVFLLKSADSYILYLKQSYIIQSDGFVVHYNLYKHIPYKYFYVNLFVISITKFDLFDPCTRISI